MPYWTIALLRYCPLYLSWRREVLTSLPSEG
jgi:hypothetical protein